MKLEFVRRQHEIGEVHSFFFNPLIAVNWQAGQYLNLTMPNVPPVFADRLFTIASAPYEGFIQITTIIGPSPFKQKLNSLQPGDIVEADQVGGDFIWELPERVISSLPKNLAKNPKRLFIAGGIGITPYISIIRDRLHSNDFLNATLLYAGKPDGRPFVEELEIASKQSELTVRDYTSTRLTLEQLLKDFPDIKDYVVYLAGSQKFSETLGEGLITNGFPRAQIKYDYFDGYTTLEY